MWSVRRVALVGCVVPAVSLWHARSVSHGPREQSVRLPVPREEGAGGETKPEDKALNRLAQIVAREFSQAASENSLTWELYELTRLLSAEEKHQYRRLHTRFNHVFFF